MDAGNFSDIAMSILTENAKVVYNGSDAAEGLEEVKGKNGVALLAIPGNFSQSIYANNPGEIEIDSWTLYFAFRSFQLNS
jgi:hypothetical protein